MLRSCEEAVEELVELGAQPEPVPVVLSQRTHGDKKLTKLFVGGLNFMSTERTLRTHFRVYGPVEDAVVIMHKDSNRNRGFGFVIMGDKAAAQRAAYDAYPIIDGRRANVRLAYLGSRENRINNLYAQFRMQPADYSLVRSPGYPMMPQVATSSMNANNAYYGYSTGFAPGPGPEMFFSQPPPPLFCPTTPGLLGPNPWTMAYPMNISMNLPLLPIPLPFQQALGQGFDPVLAQTFLAQQQQQLDDQRTLGAQRVLDAQRVMEAHRSGEHKVQLSIVAAAAAYVYELECQAARNKPKPRNGNQEYKMF